MERPEPLRVDQQPLLGGGPAIGVHYVGQVPIAEIPDRDPRAPLAPPELLVRFDQILVEMQRLTQAVYLASPRPDIVVRERLGELTCATQDLNILLADVHTELQGLRADLASRTVAARTRRVIAWLKGLFRWPSADSDA